MLRSILQKMGLNSTEAKVYLISLKLGTQDVSVIAKKSGLSRYDALAALNGLLDRGFMSKLTRGKSFFTAEQPEVIHQVVQNNPQVPKAITKSFKSLLPQFTMYVNPSSTHPEIAYYEGKDGIIAAYEDTLTSTTDILAIASIDDTETVFPRYVPKYYQRRKAAGILIKAIFPDTPLSRARHAKDQQELRISRLVPSDRYHFNIEINIYDDKVAYFSVKEELAMIIKSTDIAESMRNMFWMCWEMAEIHASPTRGRKRARSNNHDSKPRT